MAVIGLINPSSKRKNYQGLAPLSAIMPPHWMAVRAAYLLKHGDGVIVCDCAVESLVPEDFEDCSRIEIMPSGVHPHAFIHEQEGILSAAQALEPLHKPVEVITRLDFDPTDYSPDWDYFDLDNYYAHNWHTWGRDDRKPYGTLAASISCPFGCSFCNINTYYNRGYARRAYGKIMTELRKLYSLGVTNIKMMDELFVSSERRILNFCSIVCQSKCRSLNIWGYGRLDTLNTISDSTFNEMRRVGIRWICIGIESGNVGIRKQYGKGSLDNDQVFALVRRMQSAGISVLGNFMFGFPEDTDSTMEETFDLATRLNCEYTNFYCMVPYPHTGMETYARDHLWKLPESYSAYAQYSYDFQPLPTLRLSARDVLEFRDSAWHKYHTSDRYLYMIEHKFGPAVREEIEDMAKIELKRKLLEE